ncbi:MAG: HPF/RaiA family ribosome-associated protein [Bacteroidaceae bacterium]|nr:HPF/RaiA family ribosome-associated protein [Bacteroidaceae bacterium]
MNINIKAIHFDATEKLEEFINKKVEKLAKTVGEDETVEVQLKVVKPQTAMNKEVSISFNYLGKKIYAEKTADTFEDAVLQTVDSLKVQIEKIKARNK